MKVKAKKDYNDLEQKRLVKKGEEFDVSDERGLVLSKAGVCRIVEVKKEQPKAKTKEKKPKKGDV